MASGVDARLLKSTKFPPEFSQKVDMQKVNVQVIKKWIANRISDILGNEDDVVIELCFNLVEGVRHPDVKALQIQLTGFLEKDTAAFCKELWNLLLSAQASPQGVPKELLEAKKLELMQEKIEADRAAEETRRRRDDENRRDREIATMKDRDRRDGGRPNFSRGGRRGERTFDGGARGGRGGNRSRSPDNRFRGSRDPYGRDSYYPRGRGDRDRGRDRGWRRGRSRTRSESSRSASRSRSSSSSRSERSNRRQPRKRSRSGQRKSDRGRDRFGRARRSRSALSDRNSPSPKRRRYSSSRSRSAGRRARSLSRSPTPSRRHSSSRSSSRGRDASSDEGSRRHKQSRHRRRSASRDRKGKSGRGNQSRKRSTPDQTRNTSSVSLSPIRGKNADVSEDAPPIDS
ncbi:hypothetical protein V2G26_014647 [Clonostachys chloroleuca]